MPNTQPDGAIRTLAGSYADAIFSTDGSKLFVVSGNSLSVIDPATGAATNSYTIGTQLGAMDVSLDGQFLAIVEEQPAGGAGIFYRLDLSTGSVSTFNLPGTSALHDIGFLADGSVVVSQEVSVPLRVVDLDTGDYYQPSPSMRPNATISVSADGTYVIAQPPGIDWPLHTYDTETGTGYAVYYDPYAGAGIGGPGSAVGAVSPDGSMIVQGMTMRVYASHLASSFKIYVGEDNPAALAFSPDGAKLYVLSASNDKVIVVSTSSWEVLASYPIEADAVHPLQWSAGAMVPGEMMRVSDDGDFLSIITPAGVQIINLGLVIEPNYDGGPGDDTIVGSSGEDEISGAGGNDVLSGAAGNDTLSGDEGNDWLSGGTGADTLTGGAGNDSFYFGAPLEFYNADHIADLSAGDTIQLETVVFTALEAGQLDPAAFHIGEAAATSDHRIIYNSATGQILYDRDGTGDAPHRLIATVGPGIAVSAAMFISVTTGAETVESALTYTLADNELNLVLTGDAAINGIGNGLDNEITGNAAANQLMGLDGADTLIGNGGDDYLDGGGGADQLIGGLGDDSYVLGYPGFFLDAIDSITELAGEGNDTIISSFSVYQLPTHVENITLTGSAQSATGNNGANILTGNSVINTMSAGDGNDQLFGKAGNDSLSGDSGNDLIDGGDGIDSAGYGSAETGVTVSLAISGPQDTGGAGTDTLVSIEILGGSDYTDWLTAGASGNSLFGWNGKDFLFGGAGDDELDGGQGSDIYMVDIASDHWTAEFVDRGWGEGDLDEVRFSASVASTLTLFAGDTGIERVVIGTGTAANASAVTTGTTALNVNAALVGNALDLVGNNGANVITGTAFGDTFDGRAGNDQLSGQAGNDMLDGGIGDDKLFGDEGDDTLVGSLGYDRLYGGSGNDTYMVNDADDYAYENAGEGTDQVIASIDHQLRAQVENLTLTGTALIGKGNDLNNIIGGNGNANKLYGYGGNDQLIGGAGDDMLYGDVGNDTLVGGAGYDGLYGGLGNDVYMVTDATDFAYENAAEGTDQVNSTVNHQLRANVENLNLLGSAQIGEGNDLGNYIQGNSAHNRLYGLDGDDILYGASGDDYLFGGTGEDELTGGAGFDRMYGGAGDDTYHVDDSTDYAYENAGEGHDRVISSLNSHTLRANVERLTLVGLAVTGKGNELDNFITGNELNNKLYGMDGVDLLDGNDGSDTLDGGTGGDIMSGGSGNDQYCVDDLGDVTIESADEGVDTVRTTISLALADNIENVVLLGSGNLNAAGNGLNNVMTGNAGDNHFIGGAGVDQLKGLGGNDTLDGGIGSDRLYGGTGHDSYIVDTTGDIIFENAGEGIDSVQSAGTYVLSANVEHLFLTGSGNANGTGNDLGNGIVGNAGANILYGQGGSDILQGMEGADVLKGGDDNDVVNGGAGRDRLYGEAGADIFAFRDGDFPGLTTSTCDQIHDFSQLQGDMIRLDEVDANTLLDGDQGFSFLGNNAFTGTAGELRSYQSSGNTYVQGDTDGDGIGDFLIRLDGLHTLQASDFLI